MADGTFNPSRCVIKKAELIPYGQENNGTPKDIKDMIGQFSIQQSITSVSLVGTLTVLDNIGLLQNWPLRAEEELKLEIFCFDLQTTIKLNCQIIKIQSIDIKEDIQGMVYDLQWIGKTSYEAGKRSVIKAFIDKPASSIVVDLFKQYFSQLTKATDVNENNLPEGTKVYNIANDPGRKLYVEETKKNMSVTIPDYMPSQAIGFVANRAFSSKRSQTASLFRFFENFDGFYFVSDEWLYEYAKKLNIAKKMEYRPFVNLDGANPLEQINGLTTFSNNRRSDVGEELMGGSYYNTVVEIDILRRTCIRHDYSYLKQLKKEEFNDVTGNKATLDTDTHSEKFIEETFTPENARQFYLIRDYSDKVGAYRPDAQIRELTARRNMFARHAASTQCSATTAGRLDIQAGQIIDILMREATPGTQEKQHSQLSGEYLVHGVNHLVEDGQLVTALNLSKYGFAGAGADKRRVQAKKFTGKFI